MEEEYQSLTRIKESIEKKDNTIKVTPKFKYSPFNKKYPEAEIDILVILKSNLCLFEIKSGSKEEDSKKQLNFHKEQILNLKNRLLLREGIAFSEIKLFWVSEEYNIIENIETKEIMAFDPTFLEDPLEFLMK